MNSPTPSPPTSRPEVATTGVTPRVLVIDVDTSDRTELFDEVCRCLVAEGLVHPTYPEALARREEQYPTGLDLVDRAVAIPHTDDDQVIAPGLGLCRNQQATIFHAMDDPHRELPVRLSIFPLMTDPRQQTEMLGAAIGLLVDDEACRRLLEGSHEEALAQLEGLVSTLA